GWRCEASAAELAQALARAARMRLAELLPSDVVSLDSPEHGSPLWATYFAASSIANPLITECGRYFRDVRVFQNAARDWSMRHVSPVVREWALCLDARALELGKVVERQGRRGVGVYNYLVRRAEAADTHSFRNRSQFIRRASPLSAVCLADHERG